ncbi:MAG: hypothetical protein HN714_05505 [Formosa sp.]|jgi:hypothetical protein|nr:hypothetical protein [Formosa sp.]MDG1373716.1 hypothetical protein [Flavobacteriaceae bacterium]
MALLFAIDKDTEEVIVSKSSKGSNKINFIERIKRTDNETIYYTVQALRSITKLDNFDEKKFKLIDKVCQMIYNNHKENL